METNRKTPIETETDKVKRCQAYAYDLVEKRLREGTATAQETCFFLRLSTEEAKLDNRAKEADILLKEAKVQAINDTRTNVEATNKVLAAIRKYQGTTYSVDEEEY